MERGEIGEMVLIRAEERFRKLSEGSEVRREGVARTRSDLEGSKSQLVLSDRCRTEIDDVR